MTPVLLYSYLLLGIVNHPGFPDHIDLDLARILEFTLDLLRDISGHLYQVCIRYMLWNYHYTNLSTRLNCKRFVNTFKLIGDIL